MTRRICDVRFTAESGHHRALGTLAKVLTLFRRLLIKISFKSAFERSPVLRVNNNRVPEVMTDTAGCFWMLVGFCQEKPNGIKIKSGSGAQGRN
jgi:hypothetical protein